MSSEYGFAEESTSFRHLVCRTPLPIHSGATPSALHTIVRDELDNLYISDEFNHLIFSLTSAGDLRWRIGGKGSGSAQFWYPRGIALGWIRVVGGARRCLGVCDAWNNRVQFFDLDGVYLGSWREGGGQAFKEVCDLRYLNGLNADDCGIWLLLDRGNHRLCALEPDGHLLFEVGRPFPPSLESRWDEFLSDQATDPMSPADTSPVCDLAFYPSRILGRSETALYLFEPLASRLKQPLLGSLYPLAISLPQGGEWIAASDDVFLGWIEAVKNLAWVDASGTVLCQSPVDGVPVHSDLAVSEVWLRSGNRLDLWRFEDVERLVSRQVNLQPFQALRIGAQAELRSDSDASGNLFGDLPILESCLGICDEFIELLCRPDKGIPPIDIVRTRLTEAWNPAGKDRVPKTTRLHRWRLMVSKLRLLSSFDNELKTQFEAAMELMPRTLIHAMNRLDSLQIRRIDRLASSPNGDSSMDAILEYLEQFLQLIVQELGARIRTLPRTDTLFLPASPDCEKPKPESPGEWIRRQHAQQVGRRCLREVNRWTLVPSDCEAAPNPHTITRTSDGYWFVSLETRGTLARLEPDGKVVGEVLAGPNGGALSRPAGIAADSRDRLWVVESSANTVRIYTPGTEGPGEVVVSPGQGGTLCNPVGILPSPDGSMLIADTYHHRIVRVRDTGSAEVFCGREGTAAGEFRRPVTLCRDAQDPYSGFWVVEPNNHRLQKFDWSGRFIKSVGTCGPGRGSLLVPTFAAQFTDGILAISQSFGSCLKLISPVGDELDCVFFDYLPGGLYAIGSNLLVTEWNNRLIRVYERVH